MLRLAKDYMGSVLLFLSLLESGHDIRISYERGMIC